MDTYLRTYHSFIYDMENYKSLLDSKTILKDEEKE